jgi:hypothetical protein
MMSFTRMFFFVSPLCPYDLLLRAHPAPHPRRILPNEIFHGILTFSDYGPKLLRPGSSPIIEIYAISVADEFEIDLDDDESLLSDSSTAPHPIRSLSNYYHHFRCLRKDSSGDLPPHISFDLTLDFLSGADTDLPRNQYDESQT